MDGILSQVSVHKPRNNVTQTNKKPTRDRELPCNTITQFFIEVVQSLMRDVRDSEGFQEDEDSR